MGAAVFLQPAMAEAIRMTTSSSAQILVLERMFFFLLCII
jgi:hypothetical protein